MVQGMNLGNNNHDDDQYEYDEEEEVVEPSKKSNGIGMKIFKGVTVFSGISLILMIGLQFSGGTDADTAPEDYGEEYVHDVVLPDGVEFDEDEENIYVLADEYMIYEPFSKAGLIEHMSMNESLASDKIESTIDHLDVDWNDAAVRAVRRYAETFVSDADEEGLRAHLEYEQFTEEEINYAVENTDLEALVVEIEAMFDEMDAEMQEEIDQIESEMEEEDSE